MGHEGRAQTCAKDEIVAERVEPLGIFERGRLRRRLLSHHFRSSFTGPELEGVLATCKTAPKTCARPPTLMEASDADAPPSDGKPWAEVVAEHAEALGMDATADAELLWIAERSLRAPLPDGWRDAWDATHRTPYYYSDDGGGPQLSLIHI